MGGVASGGCCADLPCREGAASGWLLWVSRQPLLNKSSYSPCFFRTHRPLHTQHSQADPGSSTLPCMHSCTLNTQHSTVHATAQPSYYHHPHNCQALTTAVSPSTASRPCPLPQATGQLWTQSGKRTTALGRRQGAGRGACWWRTMQAAWQSISQSTSSNVLFFRGAAKGCETERPVLARVFWFLCPSDCLLLLNSSLVSC